jgi:hypothetical protein
VQYSQFELKKTTSVLGDLANPILRPDRTVLSVQVLKGTRGFSVGA